MQCFLNYVILLGNQAKKSKAGIVGGPGPPAIMNIDKRMVNRSLNPNGLILVSISSSFFSLFDNFSVLIFKSFLAYFKYIFYTY